MKNFLPLLCILFLFSCGDESDGAESPQLSEEEQILQYLGELEGIILSVSDQGVFFIPIANSGSDEFPNPTHNVTIDYKGYFLDGTVFKTENNISVALPDAIEGWQIGMNFLSKESVGTLIVPSSLGHGSTGTQDIPPNTITLYDITLHDFQ